MSDLQWSDQHAWDPEHTMPDGYFIRAEPYTICKIGSRDPGTTRTLFRFEVWRGTEQLRCNITSLPAARAFAQRYHDTHAAAAATHDRKE